MSTKNWYSAKVLRFEDSTQPTKRIKQELDPDPEKNGNKLYQSASGAPGGMHGGMPGAGAAPGSILGSSPATTTSTGNVQL